MNYEVMVKALNVIKDSVINTDFPLTNKLADAIYAIETVLAKPEEITDYHEGWEEGFKAGKLAKPEQKVLGSGLCLHPSVLDYLDKKMVRTRLDYQPYTGAGEASKIKHSLEPMPEQDATVCGYDETVGMCTNNPCCEQEPVSHLWECIGRWSAYLAANGKQGNLAPPTWLVDAVKAATAPPRKPWVGLTDEEFKFIASKYLLNTSSGLGYFQEEIEAKLKEKNTTNQ